MKAEPSLINWPLWAAVIRGSSITQGKTLGQPELPEENTPNRLEVLSLHHQTGLWPGLQMQRPVGSASYRRPRNRAQGTPGMQPGQLRLWEILRDKQPGFPNKHSSRK